MIGIDKRCGKATHSKTDARGPNRSAHRNLGFVPSRQAAGTSARSARVAAEVRFLCSEATPLVMSVDAVCPKRAFNSGATLSGYNCGFELWNVDRLVAQILLHRTVAQYGPSEMGWFQHFVG